MTGLTGTTADQLLAMAGDGVRRELVDGEVRAMAPAGFEHGQVALSIGALVREHVRSRGLGVVVAADVVDVCAWLAAGTRLVWVVYPAQRLVVVHEPSGTARHLSGADRLDGGDVLPGFDVEVASVFA